MSHPEVDAWEKHRQEIKRDLMAGGMTADQADEEATREVRREIRDSPPIKTAR